MGTPRPVALSVRHHTRESHSQSQLARQADDDAEYAVNPGRILDPDEADAFR